MKFFGGIRSPRQDLAFEEVLNHRWSGAPDTVETTLSDGPLWGVVVALLVFVLIIGYRIIALGMGEDGQFYRARAAANLNRVHYSSAPRGIVTDRTGVTIAGNRAIFSAILDLREFLRSTTQEKTLSVIEQILGLPKAELLQEIQKRNAAQITDPIVLSSSLEKNQIIQLKSLGNASLDVVAGYEREYVDGPVFSSVVGYTNLANAEDIQRDARLTSRDMVGRSGIESEYDAELRGTPSITVITRDARGQVLGTQEKSPARPGATIRLSIDAPLQKYFYDRMQNRLKTLGRAAGGALIMNPQTGEILSLMSFPTFDNNIFVTSGRSDEKREALTSAGRPLFNRIVSGQYNPGSTVKPLVALAALAEGLVSPTREVFSPGYLELPNKYDPSHPLRFLDWRYQGTINMYTALAFSSNVYFYSVGGGANGITGLGITRLISWWKKFGFGTQTGVDLASEAKGFLPSPEWKEKSFSRPWLLGDTFNVSIGQGDFLVTPLQLLNYICAIANGGTLYRPHLVGGSEKKEVLGDLTSLAAQIAEVQKGMREGVTNPRGTSYQLHDLPIAIAAKTGSAQIKNNTQENAFFVGYIPVEALDAVGVSRDRQIAILVMIENSKEGSLNAVPVAREVLNWYYYNRIIK